MGRAMSTILSLPAALRFPRTGLLARRLAEGVLNLERSVLTQLSLMVQRSRQRDALARMDDRQLDDLGLPRPLVARELTKWFWQP